MVAMESADPYNLQRFVDAQHPIYVEVLDELQAGRKETRWMWFIFPQIKGLGTSPTGSSTRSTAAPSRTSSATPAT
jgi:uncharacterized protein (DUF1810 family)